MWREAEKRGLSRRRFLELAGLVGAGAPLSVACTSNGGESAGGDHHEHRAQTAARHREEHSPINEKDLEAHVSGPGVTKPLEFTYDQFISLPEVASV